MSEGRVVALRAGVVESAHRVHVAVVDGAGNVVASLGDPNLLTFPRSALKPFQVLALVTSGAADRFDLTPEEIALACGSHWGEPMHLRVAASMLKKGGFEETALQCGAHEAWGPESTSSLLGHNCSGKHAGFLLLAKHLGEDPSRYLDPSSRTQQAVRAGVAAACGIPDLTWGTDGCSAPTAAMPLRAAARMFARLALPQGVPAETAAALRRIAEAMRVHPEMVGGPRDLDTAVMGAAEDRVVTKMGAEAFEGVADLTTGMGLALKVEDGAERALGPAVVDTLRQLGWLEGRAFEVLGDWWRPAIRNHAGRVVGEIVPRFELTRVG